MSTHPIADCHLHILDPARFAYDPAAAYIPAVHETAPAVSLAAVHAAHGVTHALLVNPTSGYGHDNRCMLDALRLGGGRWRGIGLAAPDTTENELSALAEAGVVGLRLDLAGNGVALGEACRQGGLFDRMRALGWVLQVQADSWQIPEALPMLRATRLPVVIDHCGRPDAARGLDQTGFPELLEFGREGAAFVKLSGAFRWGGGVWPHVAADPYIAAVLDAFTPSRCVWGSDWPFLRTEMRTDFGPELALLSRWLPDAADRRTVLWEVPQRLFGFR